MNKPSDEIVEVWRKEFESCFSPILSMQRQDTSIALSSGMYQSVHTDLAWQGFLMGRSTAVIELPESSGSFLPEGYGYDSALFDCVEKIESQGYLAPQGITK